MDEIEKVARRICVALGTNPDLMVQTTTFGVQGPKGVIQVASAHLPPTPLWWEWQRVAEHLVLCSKADEGKSSSS